MRASRNLFVEAKIAIAVNNQAARLEVNRNTFIQTVTGIRFNGNSPAGEISDNLFYEGIYSVFASVPIDKSLFKRNAAYKNIPVLNGKRLNDIDMIRTQPLFENPSRYDFRLKPLTAHAGLIKSAESSSDIGAYQRSDYVGNYTSYFIKTLESALNTEGLGKDWGYEE